MASISARSNILSVTLSLIVALGAAMLHAQATPKPPVQTAPPKAPRPGAKPPARTSPPAPIPAAKPAEPAAPPKPVAQDLRMKTVYTTGPQRTESVTYFKGGRERYEFADMILIKQQDLKRTVQISRAANTYLLIPDGAAATPSLPVVAPTVPQQKPGIVAVTTTVTDTGERKPLFGLQARHVKTLIERAATPGACDPSTQHIETDGWYIDLPTALRPTDGSAPQPTGVCVDEIKATQNGDAKALGFPVGYTTTITGDDGKPNVVGMEITELEITNLDAALFDVPPGLSEAGSLGALSKAVSDANEVKLAGELAAPPIAVQKTPGVLRVGVLEVTNRTTQQVDTRALRNRLVTELVDHKVDAAPLAGSQAEVIQQAVAHGYDYVLVAEVMDLKVSKGGGLGGALKAASKLAGGGTNQNPTEATLSVKLVQPDGKSRLATNVKGKDGSGLDLKTGLGVAKFAGSMYMNVMTGRLMMNGLNQSMTGNLSGMGMLGNPALANMQARGLGAGPSRGATIGMDPTAGAASFLVQQAMASETATGGGTGQAQTFDASIGEALEQAAKAVSETLTKPEPKKK